MNASELQAYIYEHIPIVGQNGFTVVGTEPANFAIAGRYAEHINHRNSVFGGSISTALTLAAWARVKTYCTERGLTAVIVVQKQSVDFRLPVTQDFEARVRPFDPADLDRFNGMLGKFGKAKITIGADLFHQSESTVLASYEGLFAVFRN